MKRFLSFAAALLLLVPALGAQEVSEEQEDLKLNKKNLVIKEWNMDPKGAHKFLDHVTTFSPDGKKVEEIEYTVSGQKWRKRYEYGAGGKVSKELVYDNRNRLQAYKKFEYNELNRKKIQYTYTPKGKLVSIKQFEYIAQEGK